MILYISKNKYKFLYSFLICLASAFLHSQDTIFVYEEVIEHDTVYLPKSFEKSKIQKATLELNEKGSAGNLIIKTDSINIKIPINEIIFGNSDDENKLTVQKKQLPKNNKNVNGYWHFGVFTNGFYNSNSLFDEVFNGSNFVFGAGVFVEREIFKKISLKLQPQYSFGISENLNASEKETLLDGYYFSNNIPYFFKGISANNQIFIIPISAHYNIKKWSPSIGFYGMYRILKADFITSSFTTNPPTFDTEKTLSMSYQQIGFSLGVDYKLTKKFSLNLKYLQGYTDEIDFKDGQNSFVFNDVSIQDSFVSLGISYQIK